MIRTGVEQVVIMKLTGHQSESMFLRYSHVDHQQSMEAMAKTRAHICLAITLCPWPALTRLLPMYCLAKTKRAWPKPSP